MQDKNIEECSHVQRERTLKMKKTAFQHSFFDWKCMLCGKIIQFND